MKKTTIIFSLLAFIFYFASLTFAQTTTSATSTVISLPQTKQSIRERIHSKLRSRIHNKSKKIISSYKECLNLEMQKLTKEMQLKKRTALNEFKAAVKNATSTQAKREARKNYVNVLREINKWFVNAVKEAKEKCKTNTSTTSTSTTSSEISTSTTATSTQE